MIKAAGVAVLLALSGCIATFPNTSGACSNGAVSYACQVQMYEKAGA